MDCDLGCRPMQPAFAGKSSEKRIVADNDLIALAVKSIFCLEFEGSVAAKDFQIILFNRFFRQAFAKIVGDLPIALDLLNRSLVLSAITPAKLLQQLQLD